MRGAASSFLSALCLLAAPASASAAPSAKGLGSAEVRSPGGILIIRDVISQSNIRFTVIGQIGDAVTIGIPGSVDVMSSGGQSLTLDTMQSQAQFAGGTVLAQAMISISIGARFNGHVKLPASSDYEGVMVVLAQYN